MSKVSALRWLWAPLHGLALLTGAKSFRDNPVLGSRRLNERGLHVARMKAAHAMAERRRARLRGRIDPADAAAFDRDGFILKSDYLPPELFAAVREAAMTTPALARDTRQGDTVTRRIALDKATLKIMPALSVMTRDQRWIDLIRYAGASRLTPLLFIQTIFSKVYPVEPDPQTELHADTFHPTVKAWFFLTDVGEDDGPFVYVPGSHRLTPQRLAWEHKTSIEAATSESFLTSRGSFRIAAEDLAEIGLPPPQRFAVPANTLVIADTGGFHARGFSAGPSVRCEIWAYSRRNPFLPWSGLDPAGMPGVRGRGESLYWWLDDLREKFVGKRNPWRTAGRVTATTAPDLSIQFQKPAAVS